MVDEDLIGSGGTPPPRLAGRGEGVRRWSLRGGIVLLVALLLYYPAGMVWIHNIDDDVKLAVDVKPNESRSVAVAATLIVRETDRNRWTANDPFFLPAAALDNMPNFQQGIIYALSRFAIEMSDQIGRVRGSSQVDKDLDTAAGLLKYPGDVWFFNFSTSIMPTAASEQQYRKAGRALKAYNERLAQGEATFERRADNLQTTLERIAADLGSASAVIDSQIEDGAWFIDFDADDIFYQTKGRLYAYYELLAAFRQDFGQVIQERELGKAWDQMLESMRHAAVLDPFVIVNGDPEGQLLPSHLAAQGFYLLRARTQLKEIANILLK
ncbi:MAG: DUF2333 family protein [Rhodospirillaceae bacterium]|nr:DUF2333 family protein [Rhodospirillaceae bacterium]MDD9916691.1 DUF2333 family protein [Rhodospirillaceae bacterium]MDD9925205.1 DUF2333 family protein [Rhodospirillaceae bacterium]